MDTVTISELRLLYEKINPEINTNKFRLIHYTSTEVLDKILESSTFRAANSRYLNDYSEYIEGVREINALKKKEQKKESNERVNPEIYTISFSSKEDLLSQWITYAKDSGVSFELDKEKLCNKKSEFVYILDNGSAENVSNWGGLIIPTCFATLPLIYLNTEGKKKLEKIYEKFNNRDEYDTLSYDDPNLVKLLSSYTKNMHFFAEEEVRVSFLFCSSVISHSLTKTEESTKKVCPKIEYYNGYKGILRPYIKAIICHKEDGKYIPCLPIQKILIGPSRQQQIIFDGVVHRLINGKCKIYDYFNSDLKVVEEKFIAYIDQFRRWVEKKISTQNIDSEDRCDNSWNNIYKNYRVNNSILFDALNNIYKRDDLYKLRKRLIIQWVTSNFEISNSTKLIDDWGEPELTKYIWDFFEDYYLSKEGIEVQKSVIPYLFEH